MDRETTDLIYNLTFYEDYFEPQVREGFYVSEMMKRFWAAQLEVLKVVAGICEKYEIPWYADCGTLIGAVRHHGYIPWDDDLDICMLRHDYIRFNEVALQELPMGYQLLNIHTESQYDEMITRITNENGINTDPEHLKRYHGCPYVVGIDIFPLDGLYEDEEKEEERIQKIRTISDAVKYLKSGQWEAPECRRLLANIERENHVVLHRKEHLQQQLLILAEKLFACCSTEDAEHVALMPYWVEKRNHKYDKEWFRFRVQMPFETTIVPVPAHFEEVLQIEYGTYMHINQAGGVHDYPAYIKQEDAFAKHLGHRPYAYSFSEQDLCAATVRLRDVILRKLEMLAKVHVQLDKVQQTGNIAVIRQLLEGCQTLAIAIGTDLEKKLGEQSDSVSLLEAYCEVVYQSHMQWQENSLSQLGELLERIGSEIQKEWGRKKEYLFLPYGRDGWQRLKPIWRAAQEQGITTYVMPLHSYKRMDDGALGGMDEQSEIIPEEIPVIAVEEYDFEHHYPDCIFIVNPYDAFNRVATVPPFFYAPNLKQYTEQLIFVSASELKTPGEKDEKAMTALRGYLEQPGVMYADRVLVQSEQMRQVFIDLLTQISDEKYLEYWTAKITLQDQYLVQDTEDRQDEEIITQSVGEAVLCFQGFEEILRKQDGARKKVLLYHMSVSYLLQYQMGAIAKLQSILDIFSECRDDIAVIWQPDAQIEEIEKHFPELVGAYLQVVSRFQHKLLGVYNLECEEQTVLSMCDAYYGTAGFLAHQCRLAEKPVMIQMGIEVSED